MDQFLDLFLTRLDMEFDQAQMLLTARLINSFDNSRRRHSDYRRWNDIATLSDFFCWLIKCSVQDSIARGSISNVKPKLGVAFIRDIMIMIPPSPRLNLHANVVQRKTHRYH